jgi:hypothetical protein
MKKTSLFTRAALFLAFSFPMVVHAQPVRPCNEQEAKDEFSDALDEIFHEEWGAAIDHLEKAIKVCPIAPHKIEAGIFTKTPYTPFFFLGTCRSNLQEFRVALRQFYLSSCFKEPKQGGSEIAALDSATDTCLISLKRQRRPNKHSDFIDGYSEFINQHWERSAERMWDSMQVLPEDGTTTYSHGRWPEAYLPRFQLAKALAQLGCRRQACEQLALSLLADLVAKKDPRVEIERREMLELKAACTDTRHTTQQDEMTCQQWECWLSEKG